MNTQKHTNTQKVPAAASSDAPRSVSAVSTGASSNESRSVASAPAGSSPDTSRRRRLQGHALALLTATIWGLTFVSTKTLLQSFTPFEIQLTRFVIAFLVLCCIHPRVLRVKRARDEVFFALAGLTGVTVYFLLENMALTYSTAANISVIVSSAPLFIAIFAVVFGYQKRLRALFFVGFVVAMAGIVLISFGEDDVAGVHWGDLLALAAAIVWGVYSNITPKLYAQGYETLAIVKHTFAWGIIFMLLLVPVMGFAPDLHLLVQPVNLLNILFLGLLASAMCYITWNSALSRLGSSLAGVYLYLQPAVTIVASILFLHEALTWRIAAGVILVLAGLLLSEGKLPGRRQMGKTADAR